jgi:AAA15 family ATPase/GTPase
MLKSLKIENFRGFQQFELKQLGRINLIVGKNNSGKTSILEAIHLVESGFNTDSIQEAMIYRGEFSDGLPGECLLLENLFYGYDSSEFQTFSISNESSDLYQKISLTLQIMDEPIFLEHEEGPIRSHLTVRDSFSHKENQDIYMNKEAVWPISDELTIPINRIPRPRKVNSESSNRPTPRIQFLRSHAMSAYKMVDLFSEITLTKKEDLVLQSLVEFDKRIERIATVLDNRISNLRSGIRAGFKIRLSGVKKPIPIGSLGDGIWKILGISLALVNAEDGILLIDEIDTGLHFSTMESMWRMILKTAKLLNVQVFATTHSRDCWESLAQVVEDEETSRDEVIIHRIESQKSHSVEFDGRLMSIAMDENIEVR